MKGKRLISMLLALVLMLSATACSSGKPATSSQAASQASGTTESSSAGEASEPAETTDLSADIRNNTNPTEEMIAEVNDTLNDSYLGDLYETKIPSDYSAYPVNNETPLEIWMPIDAFLSTLVTSLNDFQVYQHIQELTGIKVNFISPVVGQENDQFNLMIAGGDLPDIVVEADKYKGGLTAGEQDGAYIDLTDLIEEKAPNYAAFRSSDENRRKTTVTDEGKVLGFHGLSPYSEWMWFGPLVKNEALEKTGFKAEDIVTIQDWEDFLVAAKEKGYNEPLNYGSTYGQIFTDIINGAYGVWDWTFVDDNGKIGWGPVQPNAKEYLTLMAKWQSMGLMNADWTTADFNQRMAEAVSDDCALMMDSPDTMWGFWKTGDANVDFSALLNPVLNKGDKAQTRYKNWTNTGRPAAITTQCEDIDAAMAWLDFGYTKKGWEMMNWGEYGTVHLVNEEGRPYFHSDSLMYNDPDEQPLSNLIWKYRIHGGANIRDEHFSNPLITQEGSYSGAIREYWTENMETTHAVPPISFTSEEAAREAQIATEIDTMRKEYYAKIIMGQLPVDAFDEFKSKAEQAGLEEFLSIHQAAYDRYMSR